MKRVSLAMELQGRVGEQRRLCVAIVIIIVRYEMRLGQNCGTLLWISARRQPPDKYEVAQLVEICWAAHNRPMLQRHHQETLETAHNACIQQRTACSSSRLC